MNSNFYKAMVCYWHTLKKIFRTQRHNRNRENSFSLGADVKKIQNANKEKTIQNSFALPRTNTIYLKKIPTAVKGTT
jgi:hypothetical protein